MSRSRNGRRRRHAKRTRDVVAILRGRGFEASYDDVSEALRSQWVEAMARAEEGPPEGFYARAREAAADLVQAAIAAARRSEAPS